MKTSRTFSTISYNTRSFLMTKLDMLVEQSIICFYTFVYHFHEKDEGKDHIHLYLIPNGRIETDELRKYLEEADPIDPALPPLGIMPCTPSKFGDWYLYACHDEDYLKSKGLVREYHYTQSDFVSSNIDYLSELVHTIDRTRYSRTKDFFNAVGDGASLLQLLQSGTIPPNQFLQYKAMYETLTNNLVAVKLVQRMAEQNVQFEDIIKSFK